METLIESNDPIILGTFETIESVDNVIDTWTYATSGKDPDVHLQSTVSYLLYIFPPIDRVHLSNFLLPNSAMCVLENSLFLVYGL